MPLFRTIGAWTTQRGVDNMAIAVLATTIIALPLILGVGLFYELVSRLDARRMLSSRAHWALAVGVTIFVIALAAVLLLLPPPERVATG
ncbi:MAG TPA: hypothetical protein VNT28_03915 [Candidatus Limnocylindrales bacterium]|jgi:hypothetical protein|nr:hypothetical protein [Candidatus Limnocylindrales bacterium]